MNKTLLTTAYLAPIQYYTWLYHSKKAIIERYDHYTKQTYRNRCIIAGANGSLSLSIPIIKPEKLKASSSEIEISDHGNWQHQHWNAIGAAYNSSPYFEYYIDDFAPFYFKKYKFLFDFNEELRALICDLLEIEPNVSYSTEYSKDISSPDIFDLRDSIHPKIHFAEYDSFFKIKRYYQVFEQKHGFIPNLSIIDLLFNMGPEARLILKDSHENQRG
ncbi:MAG: WbqC family protein [Bacteroidales bacterium]|nr:WbqC family protein [Bacteroidales bacterium]